MFNAVNENTPATMQQLRRWLRVLVSRSLILGSVDRPSVHDLVKDFCEAQYKDEEWRRQHTLVVNAFRAARPADTFGRSRFDKSCASMSDPLCNYVCNEIGHHVEHAWCATMPKVGNDSCGCWVLDTPQDEIVIATARVIGVGRLSSCADAAEASEDWWTAARYWSLAQIVTRFTEGLGSSFAPAATAIRALEKVLVSSSQPSIDDVDEVLLGQLSIYLQSFPQDIFENLIEHVQASVTSRRYPADTAAASFAKCGRHVALGEMVQAGSGSYHIFVQLAEASRTHVDPVMRYAILEYMHTVLLTINPHGADRASDLLQLSNRFPECVSCDSWNRSKCLELAYNFPQFYGLMMLAPEFSWEDFFGRDGTTVIQAAEEYDFERFHVMLTQSFYCDNIIWSGGCSWPLLMHWADIATASRFMDEALDVLRGPTRQEDLMDNTAILVSGGYYAILAHQFNLPAKQRDKIAACMSEYHLTWHAADSTMDAANATVPMIRARGVTDKTGQFWSVSSLQAKCCRLVLF